MMLNFNLSGTREKVISELTEVATDSPETEIRAALADYLSRNVDAAKTVVVSATVLIHGDD